MKVIIQEWKEFEEEIEVQFPFYFREKVDYKAKNLTQKGWEYTKVISPTEEICVKEVATSGTINSIRIEVEKLFRDKPCERRGYYFPENPISEKAWDKFLKRWIQMP